MLNPGDKVVELAGVVASSAVMTGAIVSAWIIWLIKKSWLASTEAFFGGTILGFTVALLVARLLYRSGGNTVVVKVGISSLPVTIPAGLTGGISTALIVVAVSWLIFGPTSQELSLFGIALGCGAVIGILCACLGSLL